MGMLSLIHAPPPPPSHEPDSAPPHAIKLFEYVHVGNRVANMEAIGSEGLEHKNKGSLSLESRDIVL